MANTFDLEEQEQLDQLKHFWARWGNLILGVVTVALLAYAGWNFWQRQQVEQAGKAAMLYDAMQQAAEKSDAAAAGQAFKDLRENYASTTWAAQGGLLAARILQAASQPEPARAALDWTAQQASDPTYRWLARLRLAGLLLDEKKPQEASKLLEGEAPPALKGLIEDRRGDIALAEQQADKAITAWRAALAAMEPGLEYRRVIEAKLQAQGADAVAAAPAGASASAASGAGK